MDYKEIRNYIKEKDKLGSVFGLETINGLLFRLGNPERRIPCIHIAGTNGKGSIMAYIEETLIEAGMRVGRYISPTIFSYRERWMLNHEWASEEDVVWAISKVKEIDDELGSRATAFEIETAAAFLLFDKWGCDIMLIECGMGGELDATNVFDNTALNILASVSRDHMNVLGDTIEEITGTKLGIVRESSTLISYPQVKASMDVIKEYSDKNEVNLIIPDTKQLEVLAEGINGSEFIYKGERFKIKIGSHYQILNAITAIEALNVLESITVSDIRKGLENTSWDARLSVIGKDPYIIVDGAHNEDAWLRLRESLEKYFTNEQIIYIISVLADKEYEKMIEILSPTAYHVYTVQSKNPRALLKERLAELFNGKGINAEARDDVIGALKDAVSLSQSLNDNNPIVICGTLSITGEVLKCKELI
ncbi:MAG: bifunctional folylpolyglutamate synthase/dihydrofolate synthase [Eubacterium sp.]|nr:bifunctional folylpolyglutamate synthase/dihydrofolate synthase [Eubacterium sp.]